MKTSGQFDNYQEKIDSASDIDLQILCNLELETISGASRALDENTKERQDQAILIMPYILKSIAKRNADKEGGQAISFDSNIALQALIRLNIAQNLELAKLLLESGVDPNALNNSGRNALHYAVIDGDLAGVNLLLEYGANPNIPTRKTGQSALHYAVKNSDEIGLEIAKALLNNSGKDVYGKEREVAITNLQDGRGNSILHTAVRSANFDMIRFLIERGEGVNNINRDNLTPFMEAVLIPIFNGNALILGNTLSTEILSNKSGEEDVVNFKRRIDGKTVLHLIAEQISKMAVDEEGRIINDNGAYMPQHLANILNFLAENGAKDSKDSSGKMACDYLLIDQKGSPNSGTILPGCEEIAALFVNKFSLDEELNILDGYQNISRQVALHTKDWNVKRIDGQEHIGDQKLGEADEALYKKYVPQGRVESKENSGVASPHVERIRSQVSSSRNADDEASQSETPVNGVAESEIDASQSETPVKFAPQARLSTKTEAKKPHWIPAGSPSNLREEVSYKSPGASIKPLKSVRLSGVSVRSSGR